MFGPCREIGPITEISFKFIVCPINPPRNEEHKNSHVTMNFTMIMSQFACLLWTHRKDIFKAARTYQSYRASLILDAQGALLVYTLLPRTLVLYKSILVYIWVLPQLNISLTVQVFIPGFLLTAIS